MEKKIIIIIAQILISTMKFSQNTKKKNIYIIEQKYITLILLKIKKVTFQVPSHFWPRTTQVWLPNEEIRLRLFLFVTYTIT